MTSLKTAAQVIRTNIQNKEAQDPTECIKVRFALA